MSSPKKEGTKEVTSQMFYHCMYCDSTLMGNEKLLKHQISTHKDKVFVCVFCHPNVVFYESKYFFEHHLNTQHPESKNKNGESSKQSSRANVNILLKQPPNIPNNLSASIFNIEKHLQANKTTANNVHVDKGANETICTDAEKSFSKDCGKTRDVFKINASEISEQNQELLLKFSECFKIMKHDVQSKIIDTLTEIMDMPQNGCFDEETEIETEHYDDDPVDNDNIDFGESHEESQMSDENNGCATDGMEVLQTGTNPGGVKRSLPNKSFLKNDLETTGPLTCPECCREFRYPKQFFKHKESCTGIVYLCQFCGKIINTRLNFCKHLDYHKTINTDGFLCECCNKKFSSKKRLNSHKKVHNKKISFICAQCGRSFKNKVSLTYHSPCLSIAEYHCNICDKAFKYHSSLKVHMRTHKEAVPKPYVCDNCGKAYRTRYKLTEHMYVHTNERPYKCIMCSRTFRLRTSLRGHETVHSNILKHKCKICGKCFRRQNYLIGHMKLHRTGARVNVCNVCNENFKTVNALTAHISAHSAEEIEQLKFDKDHGVYKCEICGDEVYLKAQIRSHMQTHNINGYKKFALSCESDNTGDEKYTVSCERNGIRTNVCMWEKSFQCSYCPKKFKSKVNMQVHTRTHTGEKPYKCKFCDKCFSAVSGVFQHEITHTDKRPFPCTTCGKAFRRADALRAHIRIHTGERPFACKVCGQKFTQGGDCRKHERRHLQGTAKPVS